MNENTFNADDELNKYEFEDFEDEYDYDDDEDDYEEFGKFGGEEGFDTTISSAEGYHVMTVSDDDGTVIAVQVMTDEEMMDYDEEEDDLPLNRMIDHTLLKADATVEQIVQLCREAREHEFASVCVNSCWVRMCAELLRGSRVSVCTVVGFPLGAMIPEAKAFEAAAAAQEGAREIDMVLNIGALKSKDYRLVAKDITAVADAAHRNGAILKVIIEACLLTREEKIIACLIAKNSNADYVKTSTGFSTGGATVEDVALMSSVVAGELGVKAAGGIRSLEDAEKMINAGATRIGTSSGTKICGN